MINAINNVRLQSTQLGDSANPTLICPNSRTLTVQVFNAQVMYQMEISRAGFPSSGSWTPMGGASLPPGVWNFTEADFGAGNLVHSIRFAAIDPNTPTYVTASSA